jgi:hypothetical protein
MGAWFQDEIWSRPLTATERDLPIDVLELQAIVETIERWATEFEGQAVLFWCDNQVVVHALNSGRGHPLLVTRMDEVFRAERRLRAQFRCVYIPTAVNVQADLASRSNKVCSMPSTCLTRAAVREAQVGCITHVLCSDAAGKLATYRAGAALIAHFSVNRNWFDNPAGTAGGILWLEPPVDRARALCEAVIAEITERAVSCTLWVAVPAWQGDKWVQKLFGNPANKWHLHHTWAPGMAILTRPRFTEEATKFSAAFAAKWGMQIWRNTFAF